MVLVFGTTFGNYNFTLHETHATKKQLKFHFFAAFELKLDCLVRFECKKKSLLWANRNISLNIFSSNVL